MERIKRLIGLLVFCSTFPAFGQTSCTKEKIVGQWSQIQSIPGIHLNIDSLKEVLKGSTKTIGTLTFRSDDTYTYSFSGTVDMKSKRYTIDSTNCQIILGRKKKARERSNLEIIYIDGGYLVFKEDNNPKGYVTHCLVRM